MPVKNAEAFLSNSLLSLSKIYSSVDQIIIINDNSVDRTSEILNELKVLDPRFEIYDNPGKGLVDSLNYGLSRCRNKWVARFDVDDIYSSRRLELQANYVGDQIGGVFCDYTLFSGKFPYLGKVLSPINPISTYLSLYASQRTPHPGVLLNKERVLEVGGYRKEDFPIEDLSLWLRLGRETELVSVPISLLKYQISKSSTTGLNRRLIKNRREALVDTSGIFEVKVQDFATQWEVIFKEYDSCDGSLERKLLALIDFLRIKRLHKIETIKINNFKVLCSLAKSFKSFPAAVTSTFFFLFRRLLRVIWRAA